MKNENVILEKTFYFAVKIVQLCKQLRDEKKEYILTKQLMKAGTSIGANCEEGNSAQSRKDFLAKMSISLKEAKETRYWLRILAETNFISKENELFKEIDEIISILTRIIKSTRSKS